MCRLHFGDVVVRALLLSDGDVHTTVDPLLTIAGEPLGRACFSFSILCEIVGI